MKRPKARAAATQRMVATMEVAWVLASGEAEVRRRRRAAQRREESKVRRREAYPVARGGHGGHVCSMLTLCGLVDGRSV